MRSSVPTLLDDDRRQPNIVSRYEATRPVRQRSTSKCNNRWLRYAAREPAAGSGSRAKPRSPEFIVRWLDTCRGIILQRSTIAPEHVVRRIDDAVGVVVARDAARARDVFHATWQEQSASIGECKSKCQVVRASYIERVAECQRAVCRNREGSVSQEQLDQLIRARRRPIRPSLGQSDRCLPYRRDYSSRRC